MPRTLIIAVLAGATSAVVFVAPMYESVLGMLFINFTHLPLFLAGLGVLIAIAVSLLGMAFGRVISLFIEKPGFWPTFAIFMESGLAALLLISVDW